VPQKWLAEGGFIIPLYQREALYLEFSGANWRPTIAKVAVGRVNAISGKDYDLVIRPHRQDYVVIPDQHWLDGINSARGSISQFVAMPLGKGYTIEAQITDEEKHGGFQLAVFDPRTGRFPEEDPVADEAINIMRDMRLLNPRCDLPLPGYHLETTLDEDGAAFTVFRNRRKSFARDGRHALHLSKLRQERAFSNIQRARNATSRKAGEF